MRNQNVLFERIKLSATLTSEVNPSSPVIMGGNPAEKIRQASLLGYDAVELQWADPSQIPLEEIAAACKECNMKISAFATGKAYVEEGLSLIHDDELVRSAAIQRLMRFIDAASPCDSLVMIGCMRGNIPAGKQPEFYLDRLAQSIRQAAEYAAAQNVEIVIEAINRYENNYLNTAEETVNFICKNNLPNTKILLDTFHMNIEESSLSQAILTSDHLVGYVHIADSNRQYAGAGHIDLKEVMDALNAISYQGYISAECLPLPDSNTALQRWIQGVNHLMIL